MIEFTGDLWDYPADVVVITTNGTLNKKGECVMGRGCAREAKDRWPDLPKQLGDKIKAEGNHPYLFELITHTPRMNTVAYTSAETFPALPDVGTQAYRRYNLLTFPVKHQWFERADLNLIRTSALQLKRMLDPTLRYVMPRPGCGNGGRTWHEVRPLLLDLPDNVHVITFNSGKGPQP